MVRRVTFDSSLNQFRLASGPPTAEDLFVAIGAAAEGLPPLRDLREGEVAFYDKEGLQGSVWVFRSPFLDLAPIYRALKPFRSVRLGPRTAVSIRRRFAPGLPGAATGEDHHRRGRGGRRLGRAPGNRAGPRGGHALRGHPGGWGALALQTSDGRWVAREVGGDGFVLTGDPGERQLITPIKVAEHESQVGSLAEGEVALYEHPNYWGRAWVFRAQLGDLNAISGLGARIGSARLGPNTGATLYSGPGYTGGRVDLLASAPSLVWSATQDGAASLDVWSLLDFQRAPFSARAAMIEDFRLDEHGHLEAFTSYRTTIRVTPGAVTELTLGATAAVRIQVNGVFYDLDEHRTVSLAPNLMGELNIKFFAAMQRDGNFCIYRGVNWSDPRDPVWATRSNTPGGEFYAAVDDHGRFTLHKGTNPSDDRGAIWSSAGPQTCFLATGQYRSTGQILRSNNGAFFAALDIAGSFAVYQGRALDDWQELIWDVWAGGDAHFIMQPDGNLCVYPGKEPQPNQKPLWCSGVTAPGGNSTWWWRTTATSSSTKARAPTMIRGRFGAATTSGRLRTTGWSFAPRRRAWRSPARRWRSMSDGGSISPPRECATAR